MKERRREIKEKEWKEIKAWGKKERKKERKKEEEEER
jgi:hypothetical protein